MQIKKQKPVKLKGVALAELVKRIYTRENGRCAICGQGVPEGTKPHHEPQGAGRKSDEYNKMILLCNNCHYKRHFREPNIYKKLCQEYLEEIKEAQKNEL